MNPTSNPCPMAGSGVHRWLMSEANRCRNRGLTPEGCFDALRLASRSCGRVVPNSEISSTIRKAYSQPKSGQFTREQGFSPVVVRQWPKPDDGYIEAVLANGFTVEKLTAQTCAELQAEMNCTESLIDRLFPGDPLLCVATGSPKHARTASRSAWRGRLSACSLIVPSPMIALNGLNQEGRLSARCLNNVGPRRFLVVEFDNGDLDSQAARLWYLAGMAPLSLAVHSGNKSIHGWFFCQGIPEERLRNFMHRCVRLGADPATWTRCQMVRMPGGTRENGRPQSVLFFNPKTLKP